MLRRNAPGAQRRGALLASAAVAPPWRPRGSSDGLFGYGFVNGDLTRLVVTVVARAVENAVAGFWDRVFAGLVRSAPDTNPMRAPGLSPLVTGARQGGGDVSTPPPPADMPHSAAWRGLPPTLTSKDKSRA
jgi:hypothetical protein